MFLNLPQAFTYMNWLDLGGQRSKIMTKFYFKDVSLFLENLDDRSL